MSQIPGCLEKLYRARALRAVDCYFAEFIGRAGRYEDRDVLLAAAMVSRLVVDGHICLNLDRWAGASFPQERPVERDGEEATGDDAPALEEVVETLPSLDAWKKALNKSGMVGGPGEADKPLVLDGDHLYLRRYYQYEDTVVNALATRAAAAVSEVEPMVGKTILSLFGSSVEEGGDRQRLAAYTALRHRLAMITGGPGTGKTYTVARILALAIQGQRAREGAAPLKIKIAAPTGKAAVRVAESIREAMKDLLESGQLDEDIVAQIPTDASTIHRLLGSVPGRPYFRSNRTSRLDADLVVIDEVSMIDLALMAKLLEALRDDTRLILLGDMDQLASVEPGSIFGDLCRAARADLFSPGIRADYKALTGQELRDEGLVWSGEGSPLDNCLVRLYPSRRFPIDGPIGAIATAVNEAGEGSVEEAAKAWGTARSHFAEWDVSWRATGAGTAVQWHEAPDDLVGERKTPLKDFRQAILSGYKAYLDAEDLLDVTNEAGKVRRPGAFSAMKQFRVFSALRRGRHGVERLNQLIEEILSLKGIDNVPEEQRPAHRLNPAGEFYHKRLIMITRNDYALDLFNGDIGIVWQGDPEGTGIRDGVQGAEQGRPPVYAYFPVLEPGGKQFYRRFSLNTLPEHETAFAMTVHKAQGSQFERIMLMLPPEDQENLFTRELLYTAITRPEKQAILWCTEAIFKNCTRRKTRRETGLYRKLRALAEKGSG